MSTLTKLQMLGPALIFISALFAEVAAWALVAFPTSELLWYLNIRIFGVFQRSYYVLRSFVDLPGAPLLLSTAILLLGGLGIYFRRRLLVAVSSNLSFIYACSIVYAQLDFSYNSASTANVSVSISPALFLVAVVFVTGLLSFLVSHAVYLDKILRKVGVSPHALAAAVGSRRGSTLSD